MHTISSLAELHTAVDQHDAALAFISGPNCSVCHAIQPRVEELLKQFPAVYAVHADIAETPEISGQYTVFSVPAVLFFIHGKEIFRQARFILIDDLEEDIKQALNLI
ncbi:thioredoxin family protein [Pseudobacillus wudalianchiensis]|uniref:Thiol reductase thioredoxin n=1 Tax=Pseudobacillus wudalianchiensis TaxID=1743143 RepID=A0A1B9AG14_9BACI|nr:thioredoxin family protein [Bacillus wudalianchiensis]OCA82787.1 thiol reductase thioredoxin [Bacillus wudalianchiensis]